MARYLAESARVVTATSASSSASRAAMCPCKLWTGAAVGVPIAWRGLLFGVEYRAHGIRR